MKTWENCREFWRRKLLLSLCPSMIRNKMVNFNERKFFFIDWKVSSMQGLNFFWTKSTSKLLKNFQFLFFLLSFKEGSYWNMFENANFITKTIETSIYSNDDFKYLNFRLQQRQWISREPNYYHYTKGFAEIHSIIRRRLKKQKNNYIFHNNLKSLKYKWRNKNSKVFKNFWN